MLHFFVKTMWSTSQKIVDFVDYQSYTHCAFHTVSAYNTQRPAQKPKGFSSFIFLFVKGRDYVRGGLSGGRFS